MTMETGGKYEINICLHCSEPECNPTSKYTCPLKSEEAHKKKEAYYLLKRRTMTMEELAEELAIDRDFARRITRLLSASKLAKYKKGYWSAI